MKRILLILFLLVLCSCEKDKIIEVTHTSAGYTSELLATIQLKNESNWLSSFSYVDGNYYFLEVDALDGTFTQILLDGTTKQITYGDINEVNDDNIETKKYEIYENENYKIFEIYDYETDTSSFYYEKDNKSHLIYECKTDSSIVNSRYFYDEINFYFLIPKNDYVSLNEVENGQLYEIEKYSYQDNEYQLEKLFFNDELCFVYESNTKLKYIKGTETKIYDKNYNDYELTYYNFNNGNEELWYAKDSYEILMLNDEIYDLGKNPEYIINEHIILNKIWKDDLSGRELQLFDRKTQDKYIFSEYLNISDYAFYAYENLYLVENVLEENEGYSILIMNDLNANVLDLPFSKSFKPILYFDDAVLFMHQNKDEVNLYLVNFENLLK